MQTMFTRVVVLLILLSATASSQVLFFETFANNNAGWTLGPQWAIGPATVSAGHQFGNPDPGFDGDGKPGGGVAGVVIGGNTGIYPLGSLWITSPIINTAGAPSLVLKFDRWLNSDYMPNMQSEIQVFDGTVWQTMFQSGFAPGVQDSAWTPQSINIPIGMVGPCFRVRFGYHIQSALSRSTSGWNIDNVSISNGVMLHERFSVLATGWTSGPTWSIANAAPSVGHAWGIGDPSADADGVTGGGLAGVVPGGNAPAGLHGYFYLTSPTVNTALATTVTLEFRRWLNSYFSPFMTNRVEVFDGATWVVIWQSAGNPGVLDTSWTTQSFDVTAWKSPAFAIRFGYQVASPGGLVVSSWNLDNVVLYDNTPGLSLEFCSIGPGSLTVAVRGPAGGSTVNAVTTLPGLYPGGWFYGIDIGINDLYAQANAGPPFATVLDAAGSYTLTIPSGIPSGLTLYGVTVLLGPGMMPIAASLPVSHIVP